MHIGNGIWSRDKAINTGTFRGDRDVGISDSHLKIIMTNAFKSLVEKSWNAIISAEFK